MTIFTKKQILLIASIAVVLTAVAAAWLWIYCGASDVEWVRYTSKNSNISFIYPKTWVVTDNVVAYSQVPPDGKAYSKHILYICPHASRLILEGDGAANCISFSAIKPVSAFAGQSDEEDVIRKVFGNVIDDPGSMGLRIMQQSHNPFTEPDSDVNLVGVYVGNQSAVGIYQLLCVKSEVGNCVSMFRVVLDSIQLL